MVNKRIINAYSVINLLLHNYTETAITNVEKQQQWTVPYRQMSLTEGRSEHGLQLRQVSVYHSYYSS